MTPPARRDGTPDTGKDEPFYPSYAKPAKKQNVRLDKRRENAKKHEPHPLEDNWWDDDETKARKQKTDGIRLQKVLAQAGVASRRHAEVMIDQGRVEVNGKIITVQGTRIKFHPVELPDSKQVRLKRLYSGANYRAAAKTLQVPMPRESKAINSPNLRDIELVQWVADFLSSMFDIDTIDVNGTAQTEKQKKKKVISVSE